jgi:hypothetical protein
MKLEVPEAFLNRVAVVYGEKCKLHFIELAAHSEPGADLNELLEIAKEQTYAEQFTFEGAAVGTLRFNSR